MTAKTIEDLAVWRKAHEFVLGVYWFTTSFPKHEGYGLTIQIRRGAISIPANMAGGCKKRDESDKARFMNITQVSIEECRYYLLLAKDSGEGGTGVLMNALEQVNRLLEAYTKSILASGS